MSTLEYSMHYSEFCSQTQTEYLTMGCAERGLSSHQCIVRAFDYINQCSCDRQNYDIIEHNCLMGSIGGALLGICSMFIVAWTVWICHMTKFRSKDDHKSEF